MILGYSQYCINIAMVTYCHLSNVRQSFLIISSYVRIPSSNLGDLDWIVLNLAKSWMDCWDANQWLYNRKSYIQFCKYEYHVLGQLIYAHPSFLNQANTRHWHILSDILNGSVFPYDWLRPCHQRASSASCVIIITEPGASRNISQSLAIACRC